MPSATEFNYADSSYSDFLKARAAKMTDFISKLCDGLKHELVRDLRLRMTVKNGTGRWAENPRCGD